MHGLRCMQWLNDKRYSLQRKYVGADLTASVLNVKLIRSLKVAVYIWYVCTSECHDEDNLLVFRAITE